MEKDINKIVFTLYLYADMTKMIHYTTASNHIHKLCDDTRNIIMDFADKFAEQSYGIIGKPKFNELHLSYTLKPQKEIVNLCKDVISFIVKFRKTAEKKKYTNLVSIIDDFVGDLYNQIYLSKFDRNKQLDETISRILKNYK